MDPESSSLRFIEHNQITAVVDEALHLLHHAPDKNVDEPILVYSDSCMVISLIVHWLVMSLCKQLMRLLIPEALPFLQGFIPKHYIEHYLVFQEHFSLKKLITMHLESLGEHVQQLETLEQVNEQLEIFEEYKTRV